MRISHEHGFVFLAMPRCGSTTVRRVLDDHADVASVHVTQTTDDFPFFHHIRARQLVPLFEERGWEWEGYRRFCVVRNPWDRMVSLYHFQQKVRSKPVFGRGRLYNAARRVKHLLRPLGSFPTFVGRLDPSKPLSTSLENFICDTDGRPLISDVLRFEDLENELRTLLGEVGVDTDLGTMPHLNASASRRPYQDYYDEASRERVRELYSYEIESFGYRFGEQARPRTR